MVFLDLPIAHPMSERSPSQQNFVIEEDGSEYDDSGTGGSVGGDGKETNSNSSFRLYLSSTRLTLIIGSLCLIILGLSISLAVFIVLYENTFPPYEICRSKSCTRTATLFIKTMDDSVDPCEDFHSFACGNWISDTATVVSVPMYDHTTIMRDRIVGRLRTLTENISSSDIDVLQQVKAMYKSCIDTERIDDDGFGSLVKYITSLIPFNSPSAMNKISISKLLANIRRITGQNYMIELSIGPDYMNTTYNTILIDQPDVTLTKDNFEDPNDEDLQEYAKLMKEVLSVMNKTFGSNHTLFPTMLKNISTIIAYEKQFAYALTDDIYRSKPKMNNVMTLRQLNKIFSGNNDDDDYSGNKDNNDNVSNNVLLFRNKRSPNPQDYSDNDKGGDFRKKARKSNTTTTTAGPSTTHLHFDWIEYFNTLFEDIPGVNTFDESTEIIVNDLPYINELAKVLQNSKPAELQFYLAWQLIYSLGKDVSSDIRSLLDAFTMKLDGDESRPNRRTQCITLLDKTIPFALTHKYILKYVNDSVIDETKNMVDNIIKSFKWMVSGLDWMDENTIGRAILKANHIRSFIGYPTWIKNPGSVQEYYAGLEFNGGFFDNMISLLHWLAEKELKTYRQVVDTTWSSAGDSPAEADAFYDDELNAITFPAGFLQNPFVGMGLRAVDYGALGSVVGHELTHGFDTEGRYSDEKGRLNSWWSMDTLQNFLKKADCFVRQYSAYRLPELASLMGKDNHVNGQRTLAENIADNGGIREALQAYRYYIQESNSGQPEPRLPGLEKYEPEQLFFLAFAQSWCSYMNPISTMNMLQSNVHSPAKFRIIGPLSNFKEFSKIWSCSPGSKMNPAKKCVLW